MATSNDDMIISEEENVLQDDTVMAEEPPNRTSPTPSSSLSSLSEEEEEEVRAKGGSHVEVFSQLSHWIACFCVVTFDLELGQAIEVYKIHIRTSSFFPFSPATDANTKLSINAYLRFVPMVDGYWWEI